MWLLKSELCLSLLTDALSLLESACSAAGRAVYDHLRKLGRTISDLLFAGYVEYNGRAPKGVVLHYLFLIKDELGIRER